MFWIPQTVGLTQRLDSEPPFVLRLFLALVFLSRACLSHSTPWLKTSFSQIHCQCPWQTVASHWPQTDFCYFLPPSLNVASEFQSPKRENAISPDGRGPSLVSSRAGQHGFGGPWEGGLFGEKRCWAHMPVPLVGLWQVPRALSDDGYWLLMWEK